MYPRIELAFGGNDSFRGTQEIDAEEFIAVKSFKAKGKRLSTFEIGVVRELEPIRFPEKKEESEDGDEDQDGSVKIEIDDDDSSASDTDIIDDMTGQQQIDFE